MEVFEAATADQAWRKAAKRFRDGHQIQTHTGRGGQTKELLHAVFVIRNPSQRWVVSRYPVLNPAFAIVEVVWILRGRRDSAFVNYWNSKLPEFAGKGREYHGAYGYRLRRHFGMDQLERAFRALEGNPEGRQVVLQIWDPDADFPSTKGQPVAENIPCNVCALLKVRGNRLEWTQVLRSNDLFLGVPHNFVQFTTLQELLAGWLKVGMGHYTHVSDSLHVYARDEKFVRAVRPVRCEQNTDSLALSKRESEIVLKEVEERITAMTSDNLTEEELLDLLPTRPFPVSYSNMLAVVAADAARRKGWLALTQHVMASCTNPALRQLWERWIQRTSKTGPRAS